MQLTAASRSPAAAFTIALALGGCVYRQLTPLGEAVRVTANPETVQGCELKGSVPGGDGMKCRQSAHRTRDVVPSRDSVGLSATNGQQMGMKTAPRGAPEEPTTVAIPT